MSTILELTSSHQTCDNCKESCSIKGEIFIGGATTQILTTFPYNTRLYIVCFETKKNASLQTCTCKTRMKSFIKMLTLKLALVIKRQEFYKTYSDIFFAEKLIEIPFHFKQKLHIGLLSILSN